MKNIPSHDFVRLYRYGNRVKAVYIKVSGGGNATGARGGDCETKLSQSYSRARRRVYALAACNPWEYFVTLTLSADKRDRGDLSAFRSALSQYIRDLRKRRGYDIKYLLIPELHSDGSAWHMHGLLSGLPESALRRNANGFYEWGGYADRFGFMSLSPVRSLERVAAYVTKYITKDLSARAEEHGAHLYFASHGLQKEEEIGIGFVDNADAVCWDFENDYCKIIWSDSPGFSALDFEQMI